MSDPLPGFADTVVIGGGTAGAAIAGELAAKSDESLLLLEAGPDYGPFEDGRWPADLTDARAIPTSHDWGYTCGGQYGQRVVRFDRARVVGGCSAHNGCAAAIWGSRLDYDHWAELGNSGWSTEDLRPLFRAGSVRLCVTIPPRDAITPYQLAWLEAAPRAGIPLVVDLNDLDENLGMAPSPANVANGIRWNAAFAYLDPVRGRGNLTIAGGVLVDRLLIRRQRVDAVQVIRNGHQATIEAGRVVLAAAYGSPAILIRSGVGLAGEVRALGIEPVLDLPGVRRNLHDHPLVGLVYAGTRELEAAMAEFERRYWMREEQTIAKARSSRCAEGFDLHIYPVGGRSSPGRAPWSWALAVACMTPRSRGVLKLKSRDAAAAPFLDHRYLSDPDGEDARALVDGTQIARELATAPRLAELLRKEQWPGPGVLSPRQVAEFVRANVAHYFHPVGTCAMGPARDGGAVVDARGRVHGLDNCYIGDASIMPVLPRANTNIPTLVVGLRIANWLLAV